jgi:starvation-inducible DNA-binding protein
MNIATGLSETDRKAVATNLATLLADTYSLYLKSHYYHWNVTGPDFHSLHLMFETQYNELALASDEIAERIRALGHVAPGTFSEFGRLSSIPEDAEPPSAEAMVTNLVHGHETVIATARTALAAAETAGDAASADLATRRIDTHEKTAWMLRSIVG